MIKIIISPAKKMLISDDIFITQSQPVFLHETDQLLHYLQSLSYDDAKTLWQCSDKLARQEYEKLHHIDLKGSHTPALFAYEGLQYQHIKATVLEEAALDYLFEHLSILSGFYGILRPFDAVSPYRLEMQAKIDMTLLGSDHIRHHFHSLYEYWDDKLALYLSEDHVPAQLSLGSSIKQEAFSHKAPSSPQTTIVNLASDEYSKAVLPHLPEHVKVIQCVFGQLKTDVKGREKIIVKGTLAKMARGEMVRFMAMHQVEDVEELKKFQALGFTFDKVRSTPEKFVFMNGASDATTDQNK